MAQVGEHTSMMSGMPDSIGGRTLDYAISCAARVLPGMEARLKAPIFVLGFNGSGKSLISQSIAASPDVCVYPSEANATVWFPGLYPWHKTQENVPPPWVDPDAFSRLAIKKMAASGSIGQRATFALYQVLAQKTRLLNDSGMSMLLLPDLIDYFPTASVVHVVRDGRVVSYLAARKQQQKNRRFRRYQVDGFNLPFMWLLESQAEFWKFAMAKVSEAEVAFARRRSGNFVEIKYEEFCEEPIQTISKLYHELDLAAPKQHQAFGSLRNRNPEILARIRNHERALLDQRIGSWLEWYGYWH